MQEPTNLAGRESGVVNVDVASVGKRTGQQSRKTRTSQSKNMVVSTAGNTWKPGKAYEDSDVSCVRDDRAAVDVGCTSGSRQIGEYDTDINGQRRAVENDGRRTCSL